MHRFILSNANCKYSAGDEEDEKPVKKSSKKNKKLAKKEKSVVKSGKGASLEARMKAALKTGK